MPDDKREAPVNATEAPQDQPSATGHPKDSAPHEPTAWLRGRIAERVARVRSLGLDPRDPTLTVIAPLGTSGPTGSHADRACDRCDTHVPEGEDLWHARLHVLPGLVLVGALCTTCAQTERGGLR